MTLQLSFNLSNMYTSKFYIIHILFLLTWQSLALLSPFTLKGQSVEILGKLKLDPIHISEYNDAAYAMVLDTANAVALKSLQLIGVPSTGILLSEVENNSFLLNNGFTKKGRFTIPFEQEASMLGPGSFSDITGTNGPPAMPGIYSVWTGTEMITWDCDQNAGGRYNPELDQWESMSAIASPSQRIFNTALWTGTEMIVWGGTDVGFVFNSGARYNPTTDTWTPMSTVNAPSKYAHSAVWTGTEMIVWGGINSLTPLTPTNIGAKYNPISDTWTIISLSNAPTSTAYHSAVWTGDAMIIHGGINNNTTKKYNPITDTWTTLTHSGVVRFLHSAIWTGNKMIVWGGTNSTNSPVMGINTGGVYNATSNTWSTTTLVNAPTPRVSNSAVWTGSEMIIWGGMHEDVVNNTGARYNPTSNAWITTSSTNSPSARSSHSSIWTGSEQIIWGGGDNNTSFNDGKKYNPISNGYLPAVNINMYLYSKN